MDRPGPAIVLSIAAAGLLVLAALSLCLGRYYIAPADIWRIIFAPHALTPAHRPIFAAVIEGSRLPRLLAAMLIGAALSSAGSAYQAVFRNPLVSPGILGVLGGAGFGAALAIVMDLPVGLTQGLAFAGGAASVLFALFVARLFGGVSILMLVFGGLVSNALFTAMLSALKYVADPQDQLPDIVFWLLGSLTRVSSDALEWIAAPVFAAITILWLLGSRLDALAMGDDEARTLGVSVGWLRLGVIALATVLAALTISLAGIIGWIGLIVPHIARMIAGPVNARVLPLSAVLGAGMLLICDDMARVLFTTEIPLGIVTDIVGVLGFLCVLPGARRGWS